MKNLNIIIAAIAIGAAITSCQKENPSTGIQGQDSPKMHISASVEVQTADDNAGDTKVYVSNKVAKWNAGDKLAVFGSDNLTAKTEFVLEIGADTQSASFTGNEVSGDKLVAVYPSSMVTSAISETDGTYSVPVTIPAKQTYGSNGFPTDANLAVAIGGADNLAFKNVMGILKLNLYASSKRTITNLQLAANEPLCGDAVIKADGTGAPVMTFDTEKSSKIITVEFPSGISISNDSANPTTIYIVVPAGALEKGFTIAMMQSNGVFALKRTKNAQTISRNYIRNMDAISASFSNSVSTIANTHVVNPSSTTGYITPMTSDGKLIGHVTSYSINVNLPKGDVTAYTDATFKYTANADKGWAQVTALDSDSNILWSWVMWITDTPQDITLKDGSVIMDRNLGANSAYSETATKGELRGLYFQWGRKDPLVNYTTATKVLTTSQEIGTVEYVTAHPTYFILPASGTANSNDWHWAGDNTLWGKTKTIYDPCPAGYKVPEGTATTSIWQACNFGTNKGTYNSTLGGWPFSVIKDSENPLFLVGGYVASNSGVGASYSNGKYWCCESVGMTSGGNYSRCFAFDNTSVTNKSNSARYYGNQIRCQKIQ